MRINASLHFMLANFLVSAVSDLFLNYFSQMKIVHMPRPIVALRTYFKHYDNAFLTAVYAGLTILAVLILTMLLAKFIWGFATPLTIKQLFLFLALAVPLGYIADILIYKYKVFGKTLDPYYKVAGAGFYGALAFAVSILFSYFILFLSSMYI
jgi:hypothetical protein